MIATKASLILTITNILLKTTFSSYCNSAKSCAECMKYDIDCLWCKNSTFEGKRCGLNSSDFRKSCGPGNIVDIEGKKNDAIITNARGGYSFSQNFSKLFKKKSAQIFLLVDHSHSMKNSSKIILNNLKKLNNKLKKKRNITYEFAYGSFIEKPTMPFTLFYKESNQPATCKPKEKKCTQPYAFHLNTQFIDVSKETDQAIEQIINASEYGGNYDIPEAMLDGLFQVVLCDETIGWKSTASHTILVFTNEPFHVAGDGIIVSDSMFPAPLNSCNLNESKYYSDSVFHDYPSVGQVNNYLKQKNMNTFFMVPDEKAMYYEQLANALYHSQVSSLDLLDKDISNIVNIIDESISEQNIDVIQSITITPNSSSTTVTPTFMCNNKIVTLRNNAIKCALYRDLNVTMQLNVTFADYMDVNVTIASAVTNITYQFQSPKECPCNQSKQECEKINGQVCQDSPCTNCSDSQGCVCGKCMCPYQYYNNNCQCSDKNCPLHQGKLCGKNGKCRCGKCVCDDDWSGNSCSCSSKTDNCINEYNEICTAAGDCICNECHCKHSYYGNQCENCDNCVLQECIYSHKCALCVFRNRFNRKLSEEKCQSECEFITGNITFGVSQEVIDKSTYCAVHLKGGCRLSFYINARRILMLVAEISCDKPPSLIYVFVCIAWFTFLSTLYVGLVLHSVIILKNKTAMKPKFNMHKLDFSRSVSPRVISQVSNLTNSISPKAISQVSNLPKSISPRTISPVLNSPKSIGGSQASNT